MDITLSDNQTIEPYSRRSIMSAAEKALRYNETENRLLDIATEEHLHAALMHAVLTGQQALETTVLYIVNVCNRLGQPFFVTHFRNHTEISRLIINCLKPRSETPIKFGFYWMDDGHDTSILPADSDLLKAPKVIVIDAMPVLPDAEKERLTVTLQSAMASNSENAIVAALETIREACTAHRVKVFVTPYRDNSPAKSLLISCLMKLTKPTGLHLEWDDDGLYEEPKLMPSIQEQALKRLNRKQEEARKAALRAERQRRAPPKGQSDELDMKQLRKVH